MLLLKFARTVAIAAVVTGTVVALPAMAEDGPFGLTLEGSFAEGGFDRNRYVPPVTHFVLNETPFITTEVRPIYAHHVIPDKFATQGGTIDAIALQGRVALTDRLAIIATTDGWADVHFNAVLPDTDGFLDIAFGVKYALVNDPKGGNILTAGLRYTVPIGDIKTSGIDLTGRGDGYLNPFLTGAKTWESFQAQASVGAQLALGKENWSYIHTSGHLKIIQAEGPSALHGGDIGQAVADFMARSGGILSLADLADYQPIERAPVRGAYRGVEIIGPPPPASGGVHVIQMLNILEGFDLAGMGYGSADAIHLMAEAMKMAFADRNASTGDPAFLNVPVDRLISKTYADERRALIDPAQAQQWSPGVPPAQESAHTTHMTVVDTFGGVVAATHTINSLFGARIVLGDTGMIANNYMNLFDPHPGRALSIQPGKRVPTSMAPVMGVEGGEVQFALGLTGGVRIFPSAMQSVLNLIEHGMSLQEAVEAPRMWTQGGVLELEVGTNAEAAETLRHRGHNTIETQHLGGGMNGIRRLSDGQWQGAACWRADGAALALGGGYARKGVRFWPEQARG